MISRERGLSGGKLNKCMKSVDKASDPRRLAARGEVQVGAKETATFGGIILRKRLLRREMFTPDLFFSLLPLCIPSLTGQRWDLAKR